MNILTLFILTHTVSLHASGVLQDPTPRMTAFRGFSGAGACLEGL
jgi:hypothetical protein